MGLRAASIALSAALAGLLLAPAADAQRKPRPHRHAPVHVLQSLPGVSGAAPAPVADAIPPWIGQQGSANFRVNRSIVPAGVDTDRFAVLAATSGARWGLRSLGDTTAEPMQADRINVVGFSSATGPDALGVQRDVVQTLRSRRTGRVVRERIVDQDLALSPDVAWQQGPAHPVYDQFDLETVLIHELGHMAGNKEHAELCANTPLVASAAPGEWWRSPEDFFWGGCGASARSAGAGHGPHRHGAIEHVVVRVTGWVR